MKFLVFQHVLHEHPGLITKYAKNHGIKLDVIEFWKKYKIPDVSKYDALIIMGGPMGVYKGKGVFPSKEEEIKVIKKALGKIPILGFCLGSQLLAHTLGAKVHKNIRDGKHVKEIGYYDVDLTSEGKKNLLFKDFPEKVQVMQWHGDAFDLPKRAKLLAKSSACDNQVFSYKNAYGVLFHFEFTPSMVAKQIEVDREWIHKDFEVNEKKLLEEAKQKAEMMERQSVMLLNNFLEIING